MNVQQISIFLENKSGRLAEIANILGQGCVNIRSLSLADTTDFGIVRLIVDDVEKAVSLLKEEGITAVPTEVVAVVVDDKPGGLAKVLNVLRQGGINIEYLYSAATRGDKAYIIFRFDDPQRALEVFRRSGIRVLSRDELHAGDLAL
jgi:hypothetical protein